MSSADAFFQYSNMAGGFGISRIFTFFFSLPYKNNEIWGKTGFCCTWRFLHVSIPLPLLHDLTSCSNVINYFFESFLRWIYDNGNRFSIKRNPMEKMLETDLIWHRFFSFPKMSLLFGLFHFQLQDILNSRSCFIFYFFIFLNSFLFIIYSFSIGINRHPSSLPWVDPNKIIFHAIFTPVSSIFTVLPQFFPC